MVTFRMITLGIFAVSTFFGEVLKNTTSFLLVYIKPQICAFHFGLCVEVTPPNPGSKAERALSTEVLLNLCAAITWKNYASHVIEDFYSMLNVSSNIRDGFVGPFQPFPEKISEKLIAYNKKRDISDVMQIIDKYTEQTTEISEFVSMKMPAALPYTYEKFVVFICWLPIWRKNVEPVDELAKIVQSVYQSIIKPNGIYEQTKHVVDVMAKPFDESSRIKNTALEAINHIFEAIDHNDEKEYQELKTVIQNQLTKLNKKIHVSIQMLRQLKIKDILSKLSAVHRRFYESAVELFGDEFKKTQDQIQNSPSENLLSDSLQAPLKRIEQTDQQYSKYPLFAFFLYFLFIVLVLCIVTRCRRDLHSLWVGFHQLFFKISSE